MKCSICGATCRCKRARGGICCGCHSHKTRRTMDARMRLSEITLRRDLQPQLPRPARALVLLLLLVAPLQAQTRLTPDQTIGRYLSAGLRITNINADSLARVPSVMILSGDTTVASRTARLNNIQAGTSNPPPPDSELQSIADYLVSVWVATADTGATERRASAIYANARTKADTQRSLALSSAFPARGYGLTIPNHGLTNGLAVKVHNHNATPDFDEQTVYVKVMDANAVNLYWDQSLTQPVATTALGSGGTLTYTTTTARILRIGR